MSLRTRLQDVLDPWELEYAPRSYDIVGDIAVIRVNRAIGHRTGEIADAVMKISKQVKTVLHQVSPVSGEYRLRKLEWVLGEQKTETVHRESGCVFKVDLATGYFSPRLSYERMRIARQVKPGEVVVNMFAGVGCFSVPIAKHSKPEKVYSIDINPDALRYMHENTKINRVMNLVEPMEGDAREVIKGRLRQVADRVLMPLPEKAFDYLDAAVAALRHGSGTIHYYDFVHASKDEEPVRKIEEKVSKGLAERNVGFEFSVGRVVRAVGPRWYQVVLDAILQKKC